MLLVGQEDLPEAKQIHCSPFGVITKKHKPGQWRLILNLSSLDEHSGIVKELTSLSYVSVDDMTAIITKLAKGAALAKLDIKQACSNIPLDQQYLGMQWVVIHTLIQYYHFPYDVPLCYS